MVTEDEKLHALEKAKELEKEEVTPTEELKKHSKDLTQEEKELKELINEQIDPDKED